MSLMDSVNLRNSGPVTVADITAASPEELLDKLEQRVEEANVRFESALIEWGDSAGAALLRIQEERLWRVKGWVTWMDYLRDRFPKYVTEAYRLMDVVKAQQVLASAGMSLDKESHAPLIMKVVRNKGKEAAQNLYAEAAESTDGRKRTEAKLKALAEAKRLVEKPAPVPSQIPRTESPETVYTVTSVGDTSTKQPTPPLFSAVASPQPAPAAPTPTANPFTVVPSAPDDPEPVPVLIQRWDAVIREAEQLQASWEAMEVLAGVEHPAGSRERAERFFEITQGIANRARRIL